MPLEIKELIIKTTITEDQDQVKSSDNQSFESGALDQNTIIQQCVKQVLEILKTRKER